MTESFNPDSFFGQDNINVSFNIKGAFYYKITTQNAKLYSKDEVGVYEAESDLEVGTQLVAKAFIAEDNYIYVVVLTGENKLDQGFVKLQDVGNISPNFVNPEFVPTQAKKLGKIDLEVFSNEATNILYKDLKGNTDTSFITNVPNKSATTTLPFPKDTFIVFDTYKDKNNEKWLALNDKPQSSKKGAKRLAELPDDTKVKKLGGQGSWFKVEVISGPFTGKVGYAYSKFLKNLNPNNLHEVVNTAKDTEAPYLALRSGPSKNKKLLFKMTDGTQVEKLSQKSKWWKVKVTATGKTGWAFSTYLRPLSSTQALATVQVPGALLNGTPLTLLSKVKKDANLLKVKVLAGTATGKTGYIESSQTREPITPFPDEVKDVSLPLKESLESLNDKFVKTAVKEKTSLTNFNVKDPTAASVVFNELKTATLTKVDVFCNTNITYYNPSENSIDIIQPFYFSPEDDTSFKQVYASIKGKVQEPELFIEPYARAFDNEAGETGDALLSAVQKADANSTQVYKESNAKQTSKAQIGRNILTAPVSSRIADNASKFLKLSPNVFRTLFLEPNKIQTIAVPQIVTSPRWGYYLFRTPLDVLVDSGVSPVLTQEAVNFLVAEQGEPFGADLIHGYLAKLAPMIHGDASISIRIDDMENRLQQIRIRSLDFDEELEKANSQVYRGATEDKTVPHKSVRQQYQNLSKFSSFVRSSLIDGTYTNAKGRTLDNTAVTLSIKKKQPDTQTGDFANGDTANQFEGLSSIIMATAQVGDNNAGLSYQSPVIQTTRNFGNEDVTIELTQGKVALLEETTATALDELLASIDFLKFKEKTEEIEQLLKTKKNKLQDDLSFIVTQPNGLQLSLVYALADIARLGAAERTLDLGKVPFNLQTNEKVKQQKNLYEVVNTAGDLKDPGLHLRSKPGSKKGEDFGLMKDGNKVVRKASKKATGGLWYKVEVLTGPLAGKEGWSHSKWLKKLPPYKLVSIQDFSSLSGPYVMGKDATGKTVTYEPDFLKLFKQIRWLNFDEFDKATLDYNFLLVKKFSHETYGSISKFGTEEYSYILSLDKPQFDKLIKFENYKDFYDELYKYTVFYKEGRVADAQANAKSKENKILTLGDALSLNLSAEEKQQLLDQLYKDRKRLTEQAFGDTGCLLAALKLVDTFDDLYDNVVNKADWAAFVVMAIDRFKCELSKLGGGDLACLADFDVVGTFNEGKEAVGTIQNFPDLQNEALMKEARNNLPRPVFDLIYKRSVPEMPSLDWYGCLRALLIGLIYKILTELILLFTRLILDLVGLECDADFSKCEASDKDPLSSDVTPKLPAQRGNAAAAGIKDPSATALEMNRLLQKNFQIGTSVTQEALLEYISFLASKMSIANFKSIFSEDPPIHIFNHAKYLSQEYFKSLLGFPVTFTNEQLREILNLLSDNYDFSAFIAATLFAIVDPESEQCPPELFDGQDTVDAIKEALEQKAIREGAPPPTDAARKELEERVSAFCELLNFGKGLITEINSAPAQLAGITREIISGSMSNLLFQMRIKAAYDFTILKYLFTGDLVGDNPDFDDIINADASLAFNVLYQNHLLRQVSDKSYEKNFELTPVIFKGALGSDYNRTIKILKEDSFIKEFTSDMINVAGIVLPFLLPVLPNMRASLYDVNVKSGKQFLLDGLGDMEANLIRASRELNNPNYFYAWLEELAATASSTFGMAVLDPRRFPAKYKEFTEENYPNAIIENNKLEAIGEPYTLKTTFDANGIRYVYSNSNIKLLSVSVNLEECKVTYNNGRTVLTRDLPKLQEPFFVDETQDYLSLIEIYNKLNQKKLVDNPQQKIYNSVIEKSLDEQDINSTDEVFSNLIEGAFKISFDEVQLLFNKSLQNSGNDVANFFFEPLMKAGAKSKELKSAIDAKNFTTALQIIEQMGNPRSPATLFFERSDNVISDVFFEKTLREDILLTVDKIESSLATYYKDMTDGKRYDPNRLAKQLQSSRNDTTLIYEVGAEISSQTGTDWLTSRSLTEQTQKNIEEIIKRVTSEQ